MKNLMMKRALLATATSFAVASTAHAGLLGNLSQGIVDSQVANASGPSLALVIPKTGTPINAVINAAELAGLQINGVFEQVGVFGATGSPALFNALAATGLVSRVEYNQPLDYFLETSNQATGGQDVLNGAVGGVVYDGTGIGVAVVDSGVDGTHPDFAGRMGGNVKLVPLTGIAVPVTDSDTISGGGHGTHVAGTVAGTAFRAGRPSACMTP